MITAQPAPRCCLLEPHPSETRLAEMDGGQGWMEVALGAGMAPQDSHSQEMGTGKGWGGG